MIKEQILNHTVSGIPKLWRVHLTSEEEGKSPVLCAVLAPAARNAEGAPQEAHSSPATDAQLPLERKGNLEIRVCYALKEASKHMLSKSVPPDTTFPSIVLLLAELPVCSLLPFHSPI